MIQKEKLGKEIVIATEILKCANRQFKHFCFPHLLVSSHKMNLSSPFDFFPQPQSEQVPLQLLPWKHLMKEVIWTE